MIKRNRKLKTMKNLLRQFEIDPRKDCRKLRREAVGPQTKRARNNGSETIQMMKEKYENEREIRLKELELKKQELELKAKESEINEKQTEALILQGQQQTHALVMLLGKLIKSDTSHEKHDVF